jgi:hypothetical protein
MTKTGPVAPHVDPHSPFGHIVASEAFLRQRLNRKPNEVLRAHYTGESAGSPKLYWFEDCPEVRRELGMEPKKEQT